MRVHIGGPVEVIRVYLLVMTNVTSGLGFNLFKEESDQIIDHRSDHGSGPSGSGPVAARLPAPLLAPLPPPIGPGRLRQQLKGVGVNPGPAEFWILLIPHTS